MNHLSDKYKEKLVLRGDLYYADLSPVIGSEQGGLRPVLIVQNNTGNRHSPKNHRSLPLKRIHRTALTRTDGTGGHRTSHQLRAKKRDRCPGPYSCDGPDSGPLPHVFHAVIITYRSESLLHMASLCWYFSFVARPPRM